MQVITKDQAVYLLTQAATEAPKGYRYDVTRAAGEARRWRYGSQCVYAELTTEGWRPSCLVGTALHLAEVPMTTLVTLNPGDDNGVGGARFALALAETHTSVTDGARRVLCMAQVMQDEGVPWADVVEAVDDYARTTWAHLS